MAEPERPWPRTLRHLYAGPDGKISAAAAAEMALIGDQDEELFPFADFMADLERELGMGPSAQEDRHGPPPDRP
jgi:hypothetical protein